MQYQGLINISNHKKIISKGTYTIYQNVLNVLCKKWARFDYKTHFKTAHC